VRIRSVAAAENEHAVRVDESRDFSARERRAVPPQLRVEIGFEQSPALSPQPAYQSEKTKPWRLREPAQNQSDRIFRVGRCFDRVATQPTGEKK